MPTVKLTKAIVEKATPATKEYWLWDSDIRGLGCRVLPTGKKVFGLYYRSADGSQRRPRIGQFGQITVEQAREIAREWLAEALRGGDPSKKRQEARSSPAVADLFLRYFAEHARPHKKPLSVAADDRNYRKYIQPAFGAKKVSSVTFPDIERLHRSMAETPGAANRVVSLLSKAFNLAERWGWRPLNSNPTRHLTRYKERKLHRDLSELELARLAKVLGKAEPEHPVAVALIRLLLLTGCRRDELRCLRWSEVDLERGFLFLTDSKTGQKTIQLNSAAKEVLEKQEPMIGNLFVFPSSVKPGLPLYSINKFWARVRSQAGLNGVRLHDLRHSFASWGAASGLSLSTIGKLLGHRDQATTSRYADLADDPARRASEEIGKALSEAMSSGESKEKT